MIRGKSFRNRGARLHLYDPCSEKNVIRILLPVPDIKNEGKISKGILEIVIKKLNFQKIGLVVVD